MQPVIGILSTYASVQGAGKLQTGVDYVTAVERAGGLVLQLPCTGHTSPATLEQWLRMCHGILIPGGGDMAPMFYGQSPLPPLKSTNRTLDAIELELIRKAAALQIPILGICRGCQSINVAFGGTLWQDLPSQCPWAICHAQDGAMRGELFHSITLAQNSQMAAIMGGTAQQSNTFHHQAICNLAPGFIASGQTPDGIVEALEHPAGNILGVQWHPENLCVNHPAHAALFAWLVQKAAVRMQ